VKEQRFRVATTSKSALVKAKRWFYATFYNNVEKEIREENKKAWAEVAKRFVEEINKRNATELPCRITLRYETGPKGEFKPNSAVVELMEIKNVDTFTISFEPEVKSEEEKTQLKAQLMQLLKKAKELGIDVEELSKQNEAVQST